MRTWMVDFPTTKFRPGESRVLELDVPEGAKPVRLVVSKDAEGSFVLLELLIREKETRREEDIPSYDVFWDAAIEPQPLVCRLSVLSIAEEPTPRNLAGDRWARRLHVSEWHWRFSWFFGPSERVKSWLRKLGIYERKFGTQTFSGALACAEDDSERKDDEGERYVES